MSNIMGDPAAERDKLLVEFLSQQSEDKKQGYTIANVLIRVQKYHDEVKVLRREVSDLRDAQKVHAEEDREVHERIEERVEQAHERLDAHRGAIVAVKRRIRRSPDTHDGEFDTEMDTGTFDLAALQQRDKRSSNSDRVKALEAAEAGRKDDATWWKRHAITVLSTIIASLVLSACAVMATLAVQGARATPIAIPSAGAK